MSILIADSGGTKTDWVLIGSKSVHKEFSGPGLNPNSTTAEHLDKAIKEVADFFKGVDEIHFYGAGCSTAENSEMLKAKLQQYFGEAKIQVLSDIISVGRALLGRGTGIVGILGTGSNSALFKDGAFVSSRPSYGYLLGDEGSGSTIGKLFLKAFLEEDFSPELQALLSKEIKITEEELVNRLYKTGERPTDFFGSFVKVLHPHKDDYSEIQALLINAFRDYFKRFINIYKAKSATKSLYLIGSVAHYFKKEIGEVAKEEGYTIEKVLQKPMPGLIAYHQGLS